MAQNISEEILVDLLMESFNGFISESVLTNTVNSLSLLAGIAFAALVAYICLPDYRWRKRLEVCLSLEVPKVENASGGSKISHTIASITAGENENLEDEAYTLERLSKRIKSHDIEDQKEIREAFKNQPIQKLCYCFFEGKIDDTICYLMSLSVGAFFVILTYERVFDDTVFAELDEYQKTFVLKLLFFYFTVCLLAPVVFFLMGRIINTHTCGRVRSISNNLIDYFNAK